MIRLNDGAVIKGLVEKTFFEGGHQGSVSLNGLMTYKGSTGSKLSLSNPYSGAKASLLPSPPAAVRKMAQSRCSIVLKNLIFCGGGDWSDYRVEVRTIFATFQRSDLHQSISDDLCDVCCGLFYEFLRTAG